MYKKQKTMKKSQLRKIIRESINQLMNEAYACMEVKGTGCIQGVATLPCITIDGVVPTPNDIGKVIDIGSLSSGQPNYYTIREVISPTSTTVYDATLIPAGCGGTSTSGCPTCDPTQWPNMNIWVNHWTNNAAFTPPMGANQPCQHICNRLNHWENKCSNAGPEHQLQLSCKIQEGQNQA